MIFDEVDNTPEKLRQGMQSLLEQAQAYGITMRYTKEPDGTEYMDGTIAPGSRREEAIIWLYTEYRHQWLFHYHKMMWHREQEFSPCTDE